MKKKIIAIVLCVVIVIGAAVGIGVTVHSRNSVEPKIKAENLAADIKFDKEGAENLTDEKTSTTFTLNKDDTLEMDFGKNVTFNSFVLREKGDNAVKIRFYRLNGKKWEKFYELDRIMSYRLCTFEPVTAQKIRVEVVECNAPVEIADMEIYALPQSSNKDFRTVQLLSMGAKNDMVEYSITGEKSFADYYNIVTDVVLTNEISVDEKGNIVYVNGEDVFTANLEGLKKVIGGHKVNIWLGFNPALTVGDKAVSADNAKTIIKENKKAIAENLKALVEKHEVYGVTFDWEYPETGSQWSAYSSLIKKTAGKKVNVSACLGSDGGDLSGGARGKLEFVNAKAFDTADERGDYANIESNGLEAIRTFVKAGFKKEQIVLGIPTFGKASDGTFTDIVSIRGNEKQLGKFGKVLRDFEYTDKDGKTVKGDIYVESFGEARDKTKLAQECGLGGVAICSANTDSVAIYRYAIHNAVYEAVNSGIGKAK